MKRNLLFVSAALAAALLLGIVLNDLNRPKPPPVNGAKIVAAMAAYRADLQSQGKPIPPTVPLREFMNRGLLDARDLEAFAGLEVTVSLAADQSRPHEVLLSASFPDGEELVALADGSVQRARR